METPPKPSTLGEGSAKIAEVATLLEKILYLLMEDPDKHLLPALKQLYTHLGVHSCEDMVLFFLLMMLRKRLRTQRILVH
jgi:hypothetical protein